MQAYRLAALSVIVLYAYAASPPDLRDLDGHTVRLLTNGVAVYLFTRTDCPISNRYAPEIHRLYERFTSDGVRFRLVYVDPRQSPEAIRSHLRSYGYRMETVLDRQHDLATLAGVRVTPEAAVYADGRLIYRGRIDDRYIAPGRSRPAPLVRDLERVLRDVVAGRKVAFRSTRAVGCFIEDLK